MKPRVAFFDFASCEGCQLEALNLNPDELLDLVAAVDIVTFREAMTENPTITILPLLKEALPVNRIFHRLEKIRQQAKILVAFGACAAIGGVNCLKNHMSMEEVLKIVYGNDAKIL